jgi:hypothetical protein
MENNLNAVPAGETHPLLERTSMTETLALIDENLGQQGFSILNLPRIRVPSGGALNFRVETASGEKSAGKLEGVITAWRMARVYWRSREVRKKPPDCTSINGFAGIGDPGGNCKDCPYARFGSALRPDGKKSNGQACKDVRQVLFLLEDEMLPHLLNVPPTSVKAFMQYALTLLSAKTPYWAARTQLSLEKASADAQDYARIIFRLGQRLGRDQQGVLAPYHARMKDLLLPSVMDATAYEMEDSNKPDPEIPL